MADRRRLSVQVDDLSTATKHKTWIQMFVGTLSVVVVFCFIMTWIFEFNTARTQVLISLLQIPMFAEFIFAIFIIPLYYR